MFRKAVRALSVPLVNYARLVMTDDANYQGNCHGGTTLKLCEGAGFVAASQFCNFEHDPLTSPKNKPPTILPALAHVSDVTFLQPMFVGELAKLTAKPIFTSKHSVDVMVEVWAENLLKRHVRKTNTAVLTYVGTDLDKWTNEGKVVPCELPVFNPVTDVDKALYKEMKAMYDVRKQTLAQNKVDDDPYVVQCPRTSTLVQVLHPGDCWSSKFATGGAVMKAIDNCAGISTLAHTKHEIGTVTISIDALSFRYPAMLGDVLYVHATPAFAASKSLDVVVHVEIARFGNAERIITTSGKFTYVAVDSKGKPINVPPVIPGTPQEKRAYEVCKAAYEKRKGAQKKK